MLKAACKRCRLNEEIKGLGITSDAVCGVPDTQLVQRNGKHESFTRGTVRRLAETKKQRSLGTRMSDKYDGVPEEIIL